MKKRTMRKKTGFRAVDDSDCEASGGSQARLASTCAHHPGTVSVRESRGAMRYAIVVVKSETWFGAYVPDLRGRIA